MPDKNGKLTPSEIAKVEAHLNAKASPAAASCSLCGKAEWGIAEYIVEYRPFTGGSLHLGGAIYPMIMVVCGNCYNALTLVALPILEEITFPSDKEEKKNAKPS